MDVMFTYDVEVEQHVLGALLKEPTLIKDCSIQPYQLSPGRHENLLWTLKDLDSKRVPIDFVTVVTRLGKKLDKVGGFEYLNELVNSVLTTDPVNFKFHEKILLESYQKRKAIEVGNKLKDGMEVQEAITELLGIEESITDDDDGDIREDLVKVYDDLENSTGEVTGIPTGYTELDRMLTGLQEQDLVIIGARPSVGKTAFALNVAENAVAGPHNENGDVVAIFSLEMSRPLLLKRMFSITGNINAQKMRTASKSFDGDDWNKATFALSSIHNMDLRIFDKPGVDVNYIWSKVRKLKRQFEGRRILVLIDYLQIIQGNAKFKGNRLQEISDISRSLKHMARELKVCVVALSQLSRGVEQRQDKRPMLSDLRESGQIEQDADVIGFLYRDDYYDKESENKNIIEVIIAKQRNGPVGTVSLAFVKEYGRFLNLERRFDN